MKKIVLVLLSLLSAAPLNAETAKPDALLNHLIGSWVLRGTMAGKQTVHDVTCRWVLGQEYVEMHEVSREKTAQGKPAYEALVFLVHDPHTKQYGVFWLDNTDYNAFYPAGVGHAVAKGDSIPFYFTYSPGSGFHNTFTYDRAKDSWAWRLDNDSKGVLKPFARVTLTRK